MQIDSIRYAIDQIHSEEEKEWALGVLIITVSAVASNHAGHFAQPKRIDEKSILGILEKRKKSAWLEFSRRLTAVASESERYKYRVYTVEGPWKTALQNLSKEYSGRLVVYLDAPYKRDEYSRYYHVLETVALYDYPSSERKGRLRSKEKGERFRTEFFSKNIEKVERCLSDTIISILEVGKACVWSYSDNAIASIPKVVDAVLDHTDCRIYFYAMPYRHSSQRKRIETEKTSLSVIEYCVVFVRDTGGR